MNMWPSPIDVSPSSEPALYRVSHLWGTILHNTYSWPVEERSVPALVAGTQPIVESICPQLPTHREIFLHRQVILLPA